MGTGGATPYPYPSPQTLPITRTHTRRRVQFFPIPITHQGKWVPAGKITHIYNTSIRVLHSHKQQLIIIMYNQQHFMTTTHTRKQQHILDMG